MTRTLTGKTFETTVGFLTISVQKIAEPIGRFGQEKKFQTTVGLQTIPVQKLLIICLDL